MRGPATRLVCSTVAVASVASSTNACAAIAASKSSTRLPTRSRCALVFRALVDAHRVDHYDPGMQLAAETYQHRRFTADEVTRMVETGVLREDEQVELVEGELIVANPQGPTHRSIAVILHAAVERAYGAGHHVADHSPVAGTVDSIPEPDVAVVAGDARAFLSCFPGPADVKLVVEIAFSSQSIDRRKAAVYAKAGYAHFWLLDVAARRLEMRALPQADGVYAKTEIVDDAADVALPGAPAGARLRVADVLP